MGRRFLSLDFLRGISIFGMIFSAIVPYGVLPGWMYHVQNPPPTHNLDTSVCGIGWVDLVFPVFIFCMGAAIPLSGKSKIEKGAGTLGFIKGCLERFVMLWLFAYLYVLTNFTTVSGVWPQIFTVLGFCAIAMLYVKVRKGAAAGNNVASGKRLEWLRWLGAALVVLVIAVGHFCFDEVVSVHRRGIIIFLLAFLYLFGSIIWYFTRNRVGLRWFVFGLLILFTYVTKELGWPASTYANPNVRWWFNMEYFYFLLILLPATFVGESLAGRNRPAGGDGQNASNGAATGVAKVLLLDRVLFPALLVFVAWQCYALYMNMFAVNLAVSALFVVLVFFVVKRWLGQWRDIFCIAAVLHLLGLVFIFIESSISKVPCTISYCLVTFGIAVYLLMFSDFLCKALGNGGFVVQVFSGAGQNPLMSYIAFDNLIVPLMKATGFISLYGAASLPEYPLTGVLRAAVAVLFTMWFVYLSGKRGFVWRA